MSSRSIAPHLNIFSSEDTMENVVIVEGNYVPNEDIVLVEPFVPRTDSQPRSGPTYNSRVVRLQGDNFLIRMTPDEFAKKHDFRLLPEDNVAINPALAMKFRIQKFEPTATYSPDKPYLTRLTWPASNPDEAARWKLLLTKPDDVYAMLHTKNPQPSASPDSTPDGPTRPGRQRRDPKGPAPANT